MDWLDGAKLRDLGGQLAGNLLKKLSSSNIKADIFVEGVFVRMSVSFNCNIPVDNVGKPSYFIIQVDYGCYISKSTAD